MIGLTILGATGSIGIKTLNVVASNKDKYKIVALTAHQNADLLAKQCITWEPEYAVIGDEHQAQLLQNMLTDAKVGTEVLSGTDGLEYVATLPNADYVMAAIVGIAGLLPTLAAVREGKRVLLANKESLVVSGHLFMSVVEQSGAELLPIDSEHNAIFQCIPDNYANKVAEAGVEKMLLTASGGACRDVSLDQLSSISPEQACAHPNWEMGKKVSVDSATMMNKGLEVIEACCLFGMALEKIEVVLHPQSIVHSMVQYIDGSVLAQMSYPDMRTAIAHALAWPQRIHSGVEPLDLVAVARLDFASPDLQRYPCLQLACDAIVAGGSSPAVMNAANEIAVDMFLNRKILFTDIARLIEATLENVSTGSVDSIDDMLLVDADARQFARVYANEELSV